MRASSAGVDQVERAIFFGAGLSRSSGIPTATEFLEEVLTALEVSAADATALRSLSLPFELFVQTLSERTDIGPLLALFEGGTPNPYHHCLAQLAARGAVRTFLTTNFDTLLEQALLEVGLKRGRDFLVYDEPSKFARIRWATKKILVIKLHGSVKSPEPLGVTLARVAARASSASIRHALAPVLAGIRCREVYVAGYSFSDVFDITPVMREAEPWAVRLVHIIHGPATSPEGRRADAPPRYLTQPARTLRGRTEAYFRLVARRHDARLLPTRAISKGAESNVGRAVTSWTAAVDSAEREVVRLYTLARLLYRYGRFASALDHIKQAEAEARRRNLPRWQAEAHLNSGIFHYRIGEYRYAVHYAAAAVRTAIDCGYDRVFANALGNLGNGLYALGRLKQALVWQRRAAEAARGLGYSELLANTYGNIGIIHETAGRFGLAIKFHRRASGVASGIGDALGLARHAANLALCYNKVGQTIEATAAASRSLDLARLTSQPHIEAAALAELARARHVAEPIDAKWLIDQAIALAALSDPGSRPLYLGISAEICRDLGELEEALARLEEARADVVARLGLRSGQAANFQRRMDELRHHTPTKT